MDTNLESIQRLANKAFYRVVMTKLLLVFSLLGLFGLCYLNDSLSMNVAIWLMAVLMVLIAVILWPIVNLRALYTPTAMAEHLNRQWPTLEHSCQLLLLAPEQLSMLQRLQYQRVNQAYEQLQQQGQLSQVLPPQQLKPVWGLWLVALCGWGIEQLMPLQGSTTSKPPSHGAKPLETRLSQTSIKVTPPEYSQLAPTHATQGDIELLAGSMVNWNFTITNPQGPYQLKIDQQLVGLDTRDHKVFSATIKVDKTSLYRLVNLQGQALSEVYSMAVTQDQRPTVRVLEPQQSLLLLAKTEGAENGPQLLTKALVSDDFGLSKVKIKASVAKGTGEAVKFRDHSFDMDGKALTEQGEIHHKQWNLKALGMEPGDELYFTVMAWDNKMPEAQQGRSATVIVRWLDEEQDQIAAQGVLLNYQAEYFRSQRQIIIETEQLIADQAQLTQTQFEQTSTELGFAQSDLKQRYGQYLGDEFGEGPGDQADFIGGHGGEDSEHDHDDHGHHHDKVSEALQQGAESHQHQHQDQQVSHNQLGSADAVLTEFAHAHEEVHVGEVSAQNPKAMMKKAVSQMWQAELHLMLAQPEQALPYELKAYKYLKLAKQAERIYVKRLGFEPPPVSEDKRLSGELDEVNSYQQELKPKPDSGDDELFRQGFALLGQLDLSQGFDSLQIQTLERCKARLMEMAQTRPTLIKYAATVEKLLVAQPSELLVKHETIKSLQRKLWQLIAMPVSHPSVAQPTYWPGDQQIRRYQQYLQQER